MGVLFQQRQKLASVSNQDPVRLYSLSQITENYTSLKVYDDPQIPLDYIRARIALGPPTSIQYVVDNR